MGSGELVVALLTGGGRKKPPCGGGEVKRRGLLGLGGRCWGLNQRKAYVCAQFLALWIGYPVRIPDGVFSANRRSLVVDGASDGLSYGTCEGNTTGGGAPGALHANEVFVQFFCEMGGHKPQGMGIGFCVVE